MHLFSPCIACYPLSACTGLLTKPVVFVLSNEPGIGGKNDLKFLELLMGHDDFPQGKFPALHAQYTKMKEQGELCLYNKDTCQEFCLAVNSVLRGFRESLSKLQSHRLVLVKGDPTKELRYPVYAKVREYGNMLHMLSRAAALQIYLQNVDPLLSDFHQSAPKRVYLFKENSTNAVGRGVEGDELEGETEEVGVELEAWLESDNKDFEFPAEPEEESTEKGPPAWQICLRWIKLLVSYFSAASMLMGHITEKEFPQINVHLLRNSPGNNNLIPWKALLENPKYFPLHTLDHNPVTGGDCPNEEIISILEWAISSKPYHHGSKLQGIQDDWEKIMANRQTGAEEKATIV